MKLTLKEQERLMIFSIAEISRRRWKRGIKLNYIEATSIICDEMLERAREGKDSLAKLISLGSQILSKEDVIDGTETLIPMIQLEVMLPDGNKLLTVHEPIRLEKACETIRREDLVSFPSQGGHDE